MWRLYLANIFGLIINPIYIIVQIKKDPYKFNLSAKIIWHMKVAEKAESFVYLFLFLFLISSVLSR